MDIPGAAVLYNGVNMDRFPMRPRNCPAPGPLRVGILANFSPQKNQHTAINVLREGLVSGEFTLTLGGEDLYPDYAATVRAAAQGVPVTFAGYVDDVPGFMAGIDVLLLSSTHEGWPIVLMEGMAAGIPVIAPAIGDTAELLGHGEFGMLYGEGEYDRIPELLRKMKDPATYARYAGASARRSGEFDIRTTADKLRSAIDLVLVLITRPRGGLLDILFQPQGDVPGPGRRSLPTAAT